MTVGAAPAYYQVGGPGLYASLGAGLAAELVESRGQDARRIVLRSVLPDDARTVLTAAGIDLSLCGSGDVPLLWILNSPEGRRIVTTAPPEGSHELDESALVPEGIVAAPEPPSDADVLLRCAPPRPLVRATGEQAVCVDPDQRAIAERGWDYLDELAEQTAVFLPSRVQLSQLGEHPVLVAHELRRRTGRAVVARLDRDGALVLPARGGAWQVEAPAVAVVETTGAGDSHAGALAAALSDARDPRALVAATVVATAVVGHTLAGPGASGLLGAHLTEARIRAIRVTERDIP